MTKQEFENMACATVTAEEYKIIEKVYTWHPAIRNTDGKNQIATIFLAGGMAVIQDMVETAEMAMEIDNERRELEAMAKSPFGDSASISIGSDGYVEFRPYDSGWRLNRYRCDSTPVAQYEYQEKIVLEEGK